MTKKLIIITIIISLISISSAMSAEEMQDIKNKPVNAQKFVNVIQE